MLLNIFYFALAILGLSFLIFIHELGHYWMARRAGMRVEVFSIGFGKAIASWMRDGVRWQIGWLPFGGYVKIAGQEGQEEQVEAPDSFYAKSPWARIKVAFMGPLVNLVFALAAFGLLWFFGGREKNYSEFSHKIGWVDPHSELYARGVRPGDEIWSYDGHPFQGASDNLYAAMMGGDLLQVIGKKINYDKETKTPFEYPVKPYAHPAALEKGVKTTGILASANYMIYNRLPGDVDNPLPEGSPLQGSGIEYGDRLVWADGETIFSSSQLDHLLNDNRVLLTIVRGEKTQLKRVPRVLVQELKLDPAFKEEIIDWQFEAKLNGTKLPKLYAIPYDLTSSNEVQSPLKFIDKEMEAEASPRFAFSDLEKPLQEGDKIIAIDGRPVAHPSELLSALQTHRVLVIVQRLPNDFKTVPWREADDDFDKQFEAKDLAFIVSKIGSPQMVRSAGALLLLNPVLPKMRNQLHLTPEKEAWLAAESLERKKEVEAIEDPEKRAHALELLKNREKQLLLGLPMVQDRKVVYNPTPFELFGNVFEQIWRMLMALVTGTLNPKWIGGPIGIVQMMHDNSMHGIGEALYWLAAISLNLGVLNLLPIPVLDGGSILISLIEIVTGKKLSPKMLEKIVIPFAILLIGFFIFLTYNDLSRIFGGFWR